MKSIIQVAVVGSTLACHALPEVVNVKVEPVSPWGKAYVTFGINEDFETYDTTVAIMAHLVASNRQTHVVYEHVCKMDSLARENNHVLWDMKDSKRCFPMSELDFKVRLETWVQLWADGPYWAECNVGAQTPEDAGYSFWWGDTIGYRKNDAGKWVASDMSSVDFVFSESTVITYGKDYDALISLGAVRRMSAIRSDVSPLFPDFDAATVHLGGESRMPTRSDMAALINNCSWTWASQNACQGYRVTGKDAYSANSIFLPITQGEKGYYWTSDVAWKSFYSYSSNVENFTDYSHALSFDITNKAVSNIGRDGQSPALRLNAYSIRAILDLEK